MRPSTHVAHTRSAVRQCTHSSIADALRCMHTARVTPRRCTQCMRACHVCGVPHCSSETSLHHSCTPSPFCDSTTLLLSCCRSHIQAQRCAALQRHVLAAAAAEHTQQLSHTRAALLRWCYLPCPTVTAARGPHSLLCCSRSLLPLALPRCSVNGTLLCMTPGDGVWGCRKRS